MLQKNEKNRVSNRLYACWGHVSVRGGMMMMMTLMIMEEVRIFSQRDAILREQIVKELYCFVNSTYGDGIGSKQ